MIHRLIYFSGETERFTPDRLEALLETARANNAALEVTGLLIYRHGNFFQILEGAERAVEALFERIRTDARHRRVTVISREEAQGREFPDWSMAFSAEDSWQVESVGEAWAGLCGRFEGLALSSGTRMALETFVRATSLGGS